MSDRITEAARMLIEARRSGEKFAEFPEEIRPQTIEEAYAVQDIIGREFGFYGWKIGPLKDGVETRCSLLPGKAPLLSSSEPATQAGNIEGYELEVAVMIGEDLPARDTEWTAADVAPYAGSFHLVLELIGSRFTDRTAVTQFSAVADSQSNENVVLGPALPEGTGFDPATLALGLSFDDREPFSTATGSGHDGILAQLAWLANHTAARTGGLRKGDLVITGARIGPVPGEGAKHITGEGAPFAPVELVI